MNIKAMTLSVLSVGLPMTAASQERGAVENPKPNDEIVTVGQWLGESAARDLTSPVSVLSEADIKARGQDYISDILRALPGVAVSRSGAASNLTQLRLRGSEANHVLVLIDGIDVSDPVTGEFDFAGLRTDNIVRVEMLRGEQSALYGSDAIGGVINISTRTASEMDESIGYGVETGSENEFGGSFYAALPLGTAQLGISGQAGQNEGYDISGLSGEKDGAQHRGVNLNLNGLTLGGVVFSAGYGYTYLDADFDSDTDYDGRLNNTDENLITRRQRARADLAFGVAGLENRVSAIWSRSRSANPNSGFRNDTDGAREALSWTSKWQNGPHRLLGLAETKLEEFENDGGAGAFQNQSRDISSQAVAGDYRFQQSSLTLTASARSDFNERFDDAATWRLGGAWRADWDGRLYGSVGTGIKNPTMTELFGYFPNGFIGNPDIQPETSLGFDIGYDQALFGDSLSVSVNYFRAKLKDEIFTRYNPDFTSTVVNLDRKSKREGVELGLGYKPAHNLDLAGSFTWLDAKEDGALEIRRPEFTASASASWRPIEPLSLALSADYTGEQRDTDFATFQMVTLDDFILLGANLAYDINDIATLSLRGDNLLDENYQEVVGYASKGRSIYAGLSLRFN